MRVLPDRLSPTGDPVSDIETRQVGRVLVATMNRAAHQGSIGGQVMAGLWMLPEQFTPTPGSAPWWSQQIVRSGPLGGSGRTD